MDFFNYLKSTFPFKDPQVKFAEPKDPHTVDFSKARRERNRIRKAKRMKFAVSNTKHGRQHKLPKR